MARVSPCTLAALLSLWLAPALAAPSQVHVGAYLNDVQTIDLKQHSYALDVYLWFRWTDPALHPAQTLEFVNPSELWGTTVAITYEEPLALESGELYQSMRIQGRFSRKLPLYDYPFDRQVLTLEAEDDRANADEVQFVVDEVQVNPQLQLPGYQIEPVDLQAILFQYPTGFGDPHEGAHASYSRLRLALPIRRPVLSSCLKLLLPVFCVAVCVLFMHLLHPRQVDARVGIGITILLTIVALQLTTNSELPDVAYLILMDKIYMAAYVFTLASLGLVVRTAHLIDAGQDRRAEVLSRRGLWGLGSVFVLLVVGLVVEAITHVV